MDPLPPDPAAQDEQIVPATPLLSQPIPRAALPVPVIEQVAQTMSPSDAQFLSMVGRIVAAIIVVLGITSIGLCAYVGYRAVIWLWFTP
jgi:hypothetical protein